MKVGSLVECICPYEGGQHLFMSGPIPPINKGDTFTIREIWTDLDGDTFIVFEGYPDVFNTLLGERMERAIINSLSGA